MLNWAALSALWSFRFTLEYLSRCAEKPWHVASDSLHSINYSYKVMYLLPASILWRLVYSVRCSLIPEQAIYRLLLYLQYWGEQS